MNEYIQISKLVYRYAELIDQGQFRQIGELFAHTRLVNGDVITEGADNIEKLYQQSTRLYDCGTPKTQHQVTNLQFLEQNNAVIKTQSYFSVSQATDQLPLQTIITGIYLDKFHKNENKEWFFRQREIRIGLIGNLDHHLLFEL